MGRAGRFGVGKWMALVALLALPMACCLVPIGRQVEFSRLNRQLDATLRSLRPSDPSAVDPATWEAVHTAVVTAYANACSAVEYTSVAEMVRLRDDLDRKLKGRVDLDTLVWIWERLGQTGPTGERYVRRRRPLLDQFLRAGRSREGIDR